MGHARRGGFPFPHGHPIVGGQVIDHLRIPEGVAGTKTTNFEVSKELSGGTVSAKRPRQPVCVCPIGGVIDLIGKKWTLCIVTTLGSYPGVRFNMLQEALPGISPRTLSDTLHELQREGIVERQVFAEAPPRVEYSLTEEGWRLHDSVRPLMEWAAGHAPSSSPRQVRGLNRSVRDGRNGSDARRTA